MVCISVKIYKIHDCLTYAILICDLWPCLPPMTVAQIEDVCSSYFLLWVCVHVGGGLPQCVVLISSCLHACRVTPLPGNTWPQHTSSRALHLPLWCIPYTWYTVIQLQTLAYMPAVSDHRCAACNLAWMMVMIGFWSAWYPLQYI